MSEFYKKDFGNGIFAVTAPEWSVREKPGQAIMQTWIVEGDDRIAAMDSPVPEKEGFYEYLKEEFKKEIIMINTHGHIDHIGCNRQFQEVYIHEKDIPILLGGGIIPLAENLDEAEAALPYRLKRVKEGQLFALGGRTLHVIEIGGHTPGSIGLFDDKTGALFSGDAVARRILFGVSGIAKMSEYFHNLKKLAQYDITAIYSMHDDFALPVEQPDIIIRQILENLEKENPVQTLPEVNMAFLTIQIGQDEADMGYFSFAMPEAAKEAVLEDLRVNYNGNRG